MAHVIGLPRRGAPHERALSPQAQDDVRRLAECCGVDEAAIVAAALEALFARFESDAELARAIRRDARTAPRDGQRPSTR